MHKYIVMGPQGCGKGTQAKLLSERFDLTHISVGDIFRWNIQTHTKLAARIKRIMDAGQLVSDEIVDEVVRRRLDELRPGVGGAETNLVAQQIDEVPLLRSITGQHIEVAVGTDPGAVG